MSAMNWTKDVEKWDPVLKEDEVQKATEIRKFGNLKKQNKN